MDIMNIKDQLKLIVEYFKVYGNEKETINRLFLRDRMGKCLYKYDRYSEQLIIISNEINISTGPNKNFNIVVKKELSGFEIGHVINRLTQNGLIYKLRLNYTSKIEDITNKYRKVRYRFYTSKSELVNKQIWVNGNFIGYPYLKQDYLNHIEIYYKLKRKEYEISDNKIIVK